MAVNDLTDARTLAHLLKYDSVLGRFKGTVEARDGAHRRQRLRDPRDSPSATRRTCRGASSTSAVVLESTGFFADREGAGKHLTAGAEKVIISAPAKDPDVTLVLGVNDDAYDPAQHRIDLQRLVHHQLPGAGRPRAARRVRHRERAS